MNLQRLNIFKNIIKEEYIVKQVELEKEIYTCKALESIERNIEGKYLRPKERNTTV